MTRDSRPGRATWSIPRMPYMSPAAIGWTVVSPTGAPSSANRSPMPRSAVSGHPRPDDDDTVTVAPSGIRSAAARAVSTGTSRIGVPLFARCCRGHWDRYRLSGPGGLEDGLGNGVRAQAVRPACGRLPVFQDRGLERRQNDLVQRTPVGNVDLACSELVVEQDVTDGVLCHDVRGHDAAVGAVDLERGG